MRNVKRRQAGMSMIEVLVSVTILALGLVGLAALQARAMMMNQSSHYRSVAADLAADLADRIRANRSPFLAGAGAAASPDLPPDFSKCTQNTSNKDLAPTCTPQDTGRQAYLVVNEMTEWNTTLRSQLPNGSYTLISAAAAASGLYRYSLTITWLDDRTAGSDTTYNVVIE